MRLDYETLHWGAPARFPRTMRWPSRARSRVRGELRAISYVTRKDRAAVYRHEFEAHRLPSGGSFRAELLCIDGRGGRRTWSAGKELVGLGQLVDLELVDGTRVHAPHVWIATSPRTRRNGGPVILCSAEGVTIALSHKLIGGRLYPFITPHGIEG